MSRPLRWIYRIEAPKRASFLLLRISLKTQTCAVSIDGTALGRYSLDELGRGRDLRLPDSSTLHVARGASGGWAVQHNGTALPELPPEDQKRFKGIRDATSILIFLAVANAVVGIAAAIWQPQILKDLGVDGFNIVVGAFYGASAFFLVRRRSMVAAILPAAWLTAEVAFAVILFLRDPSLNHLPVTGLIVGATFAAALWRAASAAWSLKRPAKSMPESVPSVSQQ